VTWSQPSTPYPIALQVTDEFGVSGTASTTLIVYVNEPVASFTADPNPAACNQQVTFDASGSYHDNPAHSIVLYEWDFDNDGDYDATGIEAAHVYLTGGAKIVTLRVTDDEGAFGFKTRVVSVQFIRPTAAFTFTPSEPQVGEVVSFDGSGSFDNDGEILFYEWDFDDDGIPDATGMSVNHIFDVGGGSPVTLMVTDDDGVTDFLTLTVPVSINTPPVADFSFTPTDPTTATAITFSDESLDFDGTIEAWRWVFGDGATSSVQTPSHTYDDAGTYEVTLTVTDNEGAIDDMTREVIVGESVNVAPVANFAFAPALPQVDQDVQFTDQSTDADDNLVEWAWDFGDGATSAQRNPTHAFAAIGTYSVELIVTDAEGATGTITRQVVVAEPGAQIGTFAFPNPAATNTRIVFAAPDGSTGLRLRVFSILGKLVFRVDLAAGTTEYLWGLNDVDGNPLPNGLYLYIITGEDASGAGIRSTTFELLIVR
ncbi:MAG: PKD domain-containing protein, partial [Candidatus Bipolaricaulota bacterium]